MMSPKSSDHGALVIKAKVFHIAMSFTQSSFHNPSVITKADEYLPSEAFL